MKSIFIISGKQGSGKTTFLIDVMTLLQTNGLVVGGFVALHDLQSDCYQIKDIKTNGVYPLMQRVANFDQRPNHFKFFPEGIEAGNNCIKELMDNTHDINIVDEIGGYELAGQLWNNSFTQLVESSVPLLFTTKEKLLERVVGKWKIEPTIIFNSADFGDTQKAFERMKRFL